VSRSGYSDDIDNWELIKYRGQVASAIRGKRGQKLLEDLLKALDSLPEPKLIPNSLEVDSEYCSLGAVGKFRGLDLSQYIGLDPEDIEDCTEQLATTFNIAPQLIREIEFINDELGMHDETPEKRFQRVRNWVIEKLKQ